MSVDRYNITWWQRRQYSWFTVYCFFYREASHTSAKTGWGQRYE